MSEGNSQQSGGIGFLSLLTLLFIALRLTGYIDWPWWAVLAPFWGPFALILALFLVAGAGYMIAWVLEWYDKRSKRG